VCGLLETEFRDELAVRNSANRYDFAAQKRRKSGAAPHKINLRCFPQPAAAKMARESLDFTNMGLRKLKTRAISSINPKHFLILFPPRDAIAVFVFLKKKAAGLQPARLF
jgi:hypothetical protein